MKFIFFFLLMALLDTPANASTKAVPIAPIESTTYRGWTNALVLANDEIEVVLLPDIGRIAHVGWRGENNFLRLDERWEGGDAEALESDDWLNFGGDWIWPVAQDRWRNIQENGWPPSRLFDGRTWSGRAWRTENENRYGSLTVEFGAPLNVRVIRTVIVPAEGSAFQIEQRMEGMAPGSEVPVTLWQLTQIQDAEWVVAGFVESSDFGDSGILAMQGGMPDAATLQRCGDALVWQAGRAAHKLGLNRQPPWLAAIRGDTALLLEAHPVEGTGYYPEGGCTAQLFGNVGEDTYVELETLSIEQVLQESDQIANRLSVSLHRLVLPEKTERTPCAYAEIIRKRRK